VDIAAADRAKYTNQAVVAVDADPAVTLTAVGRMNPAEVLTDTTDGF